MRLVKSQREYLIFIGDVTLELGTVLHREISAHFGWKTPEASIMKAKRLEEEGVIRRDFNKPGSIRLTKKGLNLYRAEKKKDA